MAGAGGGGFIFVLTKEPDMVDEVKAVIKEMQVMFRCPHQSFDDSLLSFICCNTNVTCRAVIACNAGVLF